ncbi:MAG: phosphoribosylformylglycinamidine synthase subunit PurS [Phycisphaerae bacterium]|nr:phosphoribosylformylglycinamidine synthase subunit PurS [Phycisphaerae bacterium]
MIHRIDVRPRQAFGDPHAAGVFHQVRELGIDAATAVRSGRLFFLYGDLDATAADRVARELLIDPVVEEYSVERSEDATQGDARTQAGLIEVHLKPGVMDPVAASTEQAIRDMGLAVSSVRTGRRYEFDGAVSDAQRDAIARRLLANGVIEDVYFHAHTPAEMQGHSYQLHVTEVPLLDLDDAGLTTLSKNGHLFLNLTEMKAIQDYYRSLGREPRDVELEMIAQTWSEHCVHKTFRSDVWYEGTPLPGEWELAWPVASAEEWASLKTELASLLTNAGYAGTHAETHLGAMETAVLAALDRGTGVPPSRPAGILPAADGEDGLTSSSGQANGAHNAGETPASRCNVTCTLEQDAGVSYRFRVNGEEIFRFAAPAGDKGQVNVFIPNLIKNTVFRATRELAKPWTISVFKDNAGVIEFDEETAVCFKVETHNHPSAIEPYGGASTGIGGVIRDPMGTGMGARPVANTDVFCFGPNDMPPDDVPKGVLHPRRVMRGVVAGVRDYGNRMGIPTVNGAVYFDSRYLGNPLVFCGTVGVLPREKCFKQVGEGDAIVVVGGRTGRDGIHGATFSSGELTHSHETEFSHAVQIGNAITEKKMLDTMVQARDAGLYTAVTDCGAGGLSSAVGEMGEELGATVHLDRVPLKYAGLSYSEIWISEAQERMVFSVPPENVERILALFQSEDVEATVIGTFGSTGVSRDEGGSPSCLAGILPASGEGGLASSADKTHGTHNAGETPASRKLRLFYGQTLVGELDVSFLHGGLPRPTKHARWRQSDARTALPRQTPSLNQSLLGVLSQPNVASKEWIIRQYDHEVQGGSAIKPLVGIGEDGPGDASVIRPVLGSRKGVVVSCGMNPRLGDLDPYNSALHAVDEALRNAVAVGGDLERTAILDNFCWGNCNKPDRMGALLLSAKACYDAAKAYSVPFISGKDSLNNEFVTEDGQTIAIPPTLLISAISVIDDVNRCVTADAKSAGNTLFILGRTGAEMGGSHYLLANGLASGADVPPVDMPTNLRGMRALQAAIADGAVRAAHDLSEGGLAVAAAEMAFAGGLGVSLNLDALPTAGGATLDPAVALFNESAGRFLVEVAPDRYDAFLRHVANIPHGEIGRVTDTGRIAMTHGNKTVLDVSIANAKAAWQKTFQGF